MNTQQYLVLRTFRDTPMYLAATGDAEAYRWVSDPREAVRLPKDDAYNVASLAIRAYGSACQPIPAAPYKNQSRTQAPPIGDIQALMPQFYSRGQFNHIKFTAEVVSRNNGKPLSTPYAKRLSRIVAAFTAGRKSAERKRLITGGRR
jgi:hypothetical protein